MVGMATWLMLASSAVAAKSQEAHRAVAGQSQETCPHFNRRKLLQSKTHPGAAIAEPDHELHARGKDINADLKAEFENRQTANEEGMASLADAKADLEKTLLTKDLFKKIKKGGGDLIKDLKSGGKNFVDEFGDFVKDIKGAYNDAKKVVATAIKVKDDAVDKYKKIEGQVRALRARGQSITADLQNRLDMAKNEVDKATRDLERSQSNRDQICNPLKIGSKYALKGGKDGKYCADERGKVVCNRGAVQRWEKFTVEEVDCGKIALIGGQFGKFCADEGDKIKCNRGWIKSWETFEVVNRGNNKVALIGGRNKKYCADEGNTIRCNRNHIKSWETFSIEETS